MNKVYIVSKCLKFDNLHEFHFKGNYRGHYINKLCVNANGYQFEIGEEYLIYLKDVMRVNRTLKGTVIKAKKLFTTFAH